MTAFRPSRPTLGLDIGATKVRAARVAPGGRVLHRSATVALKDRKPSAVIAIACHLLESEAAMGPTPPRAVGVAIAAQVDGALGDVLYAPNLGWGRVPLGRRISARLGLPTIVENDVRAAAVAEWRLGAGRSEDQLALLWAGTGLGGALIVDGRLLRGTGGAAGELGHLAVVPNGRRCHCPNRGCLEAYVGGWAIAERAQEAVVADPRGGQRLIDGSGSVANISARDVFDAAYAGDRLATRILEETEEHLAAGAVTLVNALNPALVLLGGPIFTRWADLPKRLERALRARCQPPAARAVRVRRAGLGDWAPVVGAALRAAESVRGTPGRH